MKKVQIKEYSLEQGALEIEYIEEFFGEFKRKKTAKEIIGRLQNRDHLILLAEVPLKEDPSTLVPVSFKVAHEVYSEEREPKLKDLVERVSSCVSFEGRRILYSWIGGTRRDWRSQGHFRALTEKQEDWASSRRFDEIVVKTKNRFYAMRGTLDHLSFDVIKFERHSTDNQESKVYLSKRLAHDSPREKRSRQRSMETAER